MTRPLSVFRALAFLTPVLVAGPPFASAQSAAPAPAVAPPQGGGQASDDDGALDLAEPDFSVINVPTTLRLPLHKSNFHLTHRFGGNLRSGTFGQNASNLFGLDQGAVIGFEFRYAVARRLQAVAYRSSFEKTIQLSAKYDAVHQGDTRPVSVSGLLSVEGTNNFQERFAPALGLVVSREVQDRLAVYLAPIWVRNSAAAILEDRDTLLVGIGGRLRIGSTVYVTGEVTPRAAGYRPGEAEYGFGIEKRAGAHVFSLTFTNTFGTTFGQLARGGSPESLYMGFNLTRKFF